MRFIYPVRCNGINSDGRYLAQVEFWAAQISAYHDDSGSLQCWISLISLRPEELVG